MRRSDHLGGPEFTLDRGGCALDRANGTSKTSSGWTSTALMRRLLPGQERRSSALDGRRRGCAQNSLNYAKPVDFWPPEKVRTQNINMRHQIIFFAAFLIRPSP
jgi:hypothetical protein